MDIDIEQGETVAIGTLRQHLAECIARVKAGTELTITSHGEEVARLVPPPHQRARTMPFGTMLGRIKVAHDFDDLPADIIDDMENGL